MRPVFSLMVMSVLGPSARADVAEDLSKARQLVQVGRYAQGKEAFEKVQVDKATAYRPKA